MSADAVAFLLPIATHVALASCKGAVVVAVVLLSRRLFAARLSVPARHVLWLVVLAALLLPVGFQVPIALNTATPVIETPQAEAGSTNAGVDAEDGTEAVLAPIPLQPQSATGYVAPQPHAGDTPLRSLPLESWLALLWAVVVVLLAAVPVSSLIRYRRIAARATPVSGPALDLLLECRTLLGLRRAVRLCESTEIATPAVFGWLSPTLLLPPGLQQQLGTAQLRHVLLHELAHVQRHDILVNWIATGAQILHWFNPAVWFALRVMRSDMEQACDARVLGQLPPLEHADYGRTLIGVLDAFPGPVPAQGLGVIESRNQLKERIMSIAKFSSRRARSPVLAAILLLGLASVAATQPDITSSAAQSAIQRVVIKAPLTDAAVLMSQAAQLVPAASPTAAAALKQPPSDPAYTQDEAQQAAWTFSILSRIVKSGLTPEGKLDMSSLGLYPEDPSTLLPDLNHLMDEYWRMLQEQSAARCQRKDVVTIEQFADMMRKGNAELDAWRIRRWREFLASLSTEDRTPREGEPRRFGMTNVRLGPFQPSSDQKESFEQQQFNAFTEWRDGGCPVAAATESAPDARLASAPTESFTAAASIQGSPPAAAQISPPELAEEKYNLLSALFTQDLINDKRWMELAFERLEINPANRDAFLARVKRIVDDQQAIGELQIQEACAHWKEWVTPELFANAKLKQDAERKAQRIRGIEELWASLSPAEHQSTERGAMVNELSRRSQNPPFDYRKHYLERFEAFRAYFPAMCKDESAGK